MIQYTEAQYATDCVNCESRIRPGDAIVLDSLDDGWSHRRCPADAPPSPCSTCFITPCDCED